MSTQVLKIKPECIKFSNIDQTLPDISDKETLDNVMAAAECLKSTNELVGFPTETVYGLGGSALNDESVKNIFKAKNRPSDNPLIVHISSMDQLSRILLANNNDETKAVVPEVYKPLISKFWPGPLTLLFPIDTEVSKQSAYKLSKYVTNNLDTVAIRFPSDPVARALIALSDTPIAAPSANTSTKPSPTMAAHVYNDLNGKLPIILDGGACNIGLESTVVNGLVTPPTLLRPGGLSIKQIREVHGFENLQTELNVPKDSEQPVRTPGMKYKHYSPNSYVYLVIASDPKVEILFANEQFSALVKKLEKEKTSFIVEDSAVSGMEKLLPSSFLINKIGSSVDEIQFNMFRLLRDMDKLDVKSTVLVLFKDTVVNDDGLALMNRLNKASSEKLVI